MRKRGLMIAILAISLFAGCAAKDTTATTEIITENAPAIKSRPVQETAYALDTNYTGADVPGALYDYPFQKTELYVKNKDLTKDMDSDEIRSYIISAADYYHALFRRDYHSILSDQERYKNEMANAVGSSTFFENGSEMTGEEYADNLMQWFIDNEIEMDASYVSDASLLYKDTYYYLRGALTLILRSGNPKAVYDRFGISLEKGKPTVIACETQFTPGVPSKVEGIELTTYIREE